MTKHSPPPTFTPHQYALLEELFMAHFQDKRNNPRMKKSETLFALAQAARGGAIVELGAYHGNGAVSLAWGAASGGKCPVHTVDPYLPTTGWIGEPYGPADLDVFRANVARCKVDVRLHRAASLDLAATWTGPIALLFWDAGGPGLEATQRALADDFAAWGPHILPGGLYAVHEPGDHKFGGDALVNAALLSGEWGPCVQHAGFIWTLERKPKC